MDLLVDNSGENECYFKTKSQYSCNKGPQGRERVRAWDEEGGAGGERGRDSGEGNIGSHCGVEMIWAGAVGETEREETKKQT